VHFKKVKANQDQNLHKRRGARRQLPPRAWT